MIGTELRRRAEVVGVFVNASLDEVATLADRCRLTMVQLHGDEGPAYCREAARRTGAPGDQGRARPGRRPGARPAAVPHRLPPARHALDGGARGHGGDLRLAAGQAPRGTPPLVLSGGLTAENVGEAVAAVRPYAVDIGQRHRGRARAQGPGAARGVLRRRGGGRRPDRRPRVSSIPLGAPLRPLRGRYVPETLVPALDQLEARVAGRAGGSRVPGGARDAAPRLRRPAHAAVPRARPLERHRRRGVPQARGPAPHRLPQDQQRARPGAARPGAWASRG